MDEIVLRFCYVDHHVDIKVDDIDKVMWMDLINEYEEEFRKNNYDMPEFPSFKYVVNGKSFKILSDTNIMTMFERLSSTKVIFISVGKLNTLSECVQAARKLKSSMMSGSAPKNVYFAKSPPRVRVDGNSQPPSSSDVDTSQTGVDNVEISLGGNEILNFDIEETWQDIQADLSENPGKKTKTNKPTKLSVRKKKKMIVEPASQIVLSQLSSYSNAPIVEPSVIQPNLQHVVSFPKKIPRSTAARRQLVVVRGVQNPSVSHEAPIENLENVATVDNDPPIENETPVENVDTLVENETSPHNEMVALGGISSSRSVRNGLGGQEGEGLQGDVHNDDEVDMEMIQDNYDPYEDEFWQNDVDNDDSYLKRIYKNGEFYKDQEWGKIVIKPWMLFTDKQHFQQVLRDYCIQVGFAIVIH